MRKYLFGMLFSLFILVLVLAVKTPAFASGGCVPVYGGGVQCPRAGEVLIDKKVKNPSTGIFVDNLISTDPKYRPQQVITFNIIIRNSGDEMLDTVTVTDKIPAYVDFMSGDGSYDAKTKTLTFTFNNLAGRTSRTFTVKGRIVHPALLPVDKRIVCDANFVEAITGNGQKDSDEARFCIQKELEVPIVPKAGPENFVLSLIGLGSTFASGLYLRAKSKLKIKI